MQVRHYAGIAVGAAVVVGFGQAYSAIDHATLNDPLNLQYIEGLLFAGFMMIIGLGIAMTSVISGATSPNN